MFDPTNLLPNLFSFITCYFFYRLLQAFVPIKQHRLWHILALISYWAIFSTGTFFNAPLFVTLGFFLFFALVTLFTYQGTTLQKLALIIMLYPVVLGINYLCYDTGFQFYLLSNQSQLANILIIAIAFLVKTLIWWFIYTLFRHHLEDCQAFLTNTSWGIMVLISLAPLLSLFSLISFAPEQAIFVYPAIMACVVTSLGVIYLVGYMAETLKTDMENQQLKLQESYYQELAHNQLAIHKISHDMNHHLSVIATLMENDDQETLQSYFKQLSVQFATHGKQFCQNGIVNAVINAKFQRIQSQQIDTFINIDIDSPMAIDDISLCALFANTMDNAIDAALTVEEPANRHIAIHAHYTDGYLSYRISNSKQNRINKGIGGLVSTKNNPKQHGFGLKTVKDVVDKYKGTFDLSYTDKEFTIVILLQNI